MLMAKGNYTGLAMLILSVHLSLIHPSFHSSIYLSICLPLNSNICFICPLFCKIPVSKAEKTRLRWNWIPQDESMNLTHHGLCDLSVGESQKLGPWSLIWVIENGPSLSVANPWENWPDISVWAVCQCCIRR